VALVATRDAVNAADFVTGVRGVLGVGPEVLSGDEEARLSFTGATTELAAAGRAGGGRAAAGPVAPPYLVADIGGGSTEFVLGDPPVVAGAVSVDIGCVRMTERHLRSDPPTPADVGPRSTWWRPRSRSLTPGPWSAWPGR
jgi:exopolyphosphatase / guanosine-5'-triphosphate,3'-diphosphate pyrophosphatase